MRLDRVIAVRNCKTVFRDGDRCIKVFDAAYPKSRVLSEALNQARMEECGLPVPRIHEVTTMDGQWAIVSDFIKGKTLARLWEEEPRRRDMYLQMLVHTQAGIHQVIHRPSGLGRTSGGLLQGLLNAGDELPRDIRTQLIERLNSLLADVRDFRLCHGDIEPANIVLGENGRLYILDWSHVGLGDPAADIAFTHLLLTHRLGADHAENYLDMIVKNSPMRDRVRHWVPIVAAARFSESQGEERFFLLSCVRREYH